VVSNTYFTKHLQHKRTKQLPPQMATVLIGCTEKNCYSNYKWFTKDSPVSSYAKATITWKGDSFTDRLLQSSKLTKTVPEYLFGSVNTVNACGPQQVAILDMQFISQQYLTVRYREHWASKVKLKQ